MEDFSHIILNALAPLHCEVCNIDIPCRTEVHRICDTCLFTFEHAPSNEIILNQLYKNKPSDTYLLHIQSIFSYHANAPIQTAIHAMKYGYAKQMSFDIGSYSSKFISHEHIDMYVPVPLHPGRRRERGYNQSEAIALGLSKMTTIPVINALKRNVYSVTQTKLSSQERKQNVESIFTVHNPAIIKEKHVMLIDDVMTTGSTLESCAQALLESGAYSVSAHTIATANTQSGMQ
jgi:ComF family protein